MRPRHRRSVFWRNLYAFSLVLTFTAFFLVAMFLYSYGQDHP